MNGRGAQPLSDEVERFCPEETDLADWLRRERLRSFKDAAPQCIELEQLVILWTVDGGHPWAVLEAMGAILARLGGEIGVAGRPARLLRRAQRQMPLDPLARLRGWWGRRQHARLLGSISAEARDRTGPIAALLDGAYRLCSLRGRYTMTRPLHDHGGSNATSQGQEVVKPLCGGVAELARVEVARRQAGGEEAGEEELEGPARERIGELLRDELLPRARSGGATRGPGDGPPATAGQKLAMAGLGAVAWFLAAGLAAWLVESPGAVVVGAVFVWLVSLVPASVRSGGAGAVALSVAAMAGAPGGVAFAPSLYEWALTEQVDGIGVAEAPSHPDAGAFTFRDGAVRVDMRGSARRTTTYRKKVQGRNEYRTVTRHTDYEAAPLVPEGWTPEDPVPAWVGRRLGAPGGDPWSAPARGGVRFVVEETREGIWEAIEQAEGSHGVRSARGAPILRWTESPTGHRLRRVAGGLAIALGIWIAYAANLLWRHLRARRAAARTAVVVRS